MAWRTDRLPVGHALAVDLDLELCLAPGELRGLRLGLLADQPLDRELEQLAVALLAQAVHGLAPEQARVALVDGLDPEVVLLAGVVEVVLAVELAEERLGLVSEGLQVQACHHSQVQRAETQTRPRKGDELELRVESLAHGGAGVARADGYVVFVRGAVPGDRVRARITKSKRSFGEADPVELIEPSPERVEPAVPHPGAPWQVLPYERQLEEKQRQVADALSRLGGFEDPPVEPIVPAVETAALPQQGRVLVRRGRVGSSSCSASTARVAGT